MEQRPLRRKRASPLRKLSSNARRELVERLARPHPAPVIVLGHQKSGTTVVARLLGEATGLEVTSDIRLDAHRQRINKALAGKMSVARAIRGYRRSFSRPIVKYPELTLVADGLMKRFPDARFVFVLRDPRATIRSVLDYLDLPGDLPDLSPAQLAGIREEAWRRVLDSTWLGAPTGPYIAQLAWRWDIFAKTYLSHVEHMRLVRYEDFVADKAGSIVDLANDLNLPVNVDNELAVERQYESRGKRRDLRWEEFFGIRNLAIIQDVAGRSMRDLGYQPID